MITRIIYLYLFKIGAAKNKADLPFSTIANFSYYNTTLCNKDLDNAADTLYVN